MRRSSGAGARWAANRRLVRVDDGLWLSRKQRRSLHQPRSWREAYKVEPGVTPNKKGENTRFSPLKECFGYLEVHSECSLSGTISGVLCDLCPDQRAKC
jgi:hypothetical protein